MALPWEGEEWFLECLSAWSQGVSPYPCDIAKQEPAAANVFVKLCVSTTYSEQASFEWISQAGQRATDLGKAGVGLPMMGREALDRTTAPIRQYGVSSLICKNVVLFLLG